MDVHRPSWEGTLAPKAPFWVGRDCTCPFATFRSLFLFIIINIIFPLRQPASYFLRLWLHSSYLPYQPLSLLLNLCCILLNFCLQYIIYHSSLALCLSFSLSLFTSPPSYLFPPPFTLSACKYIHIVGHLILSQ